MTQLRRRCSQRRVHRLLCLSDPLGSFFAGVFRDSVERIDSSNCLGSSLRTATWHHEEDGTKRLSNSSRPPRSSGSVLGPYEKNFKNLRRGRGAAEMAAAGGVSM